MTAQCEVGRLGRPRRLLSACAGLMACAVLLGSRPGGAQETDQFTREASQHFRRGVELYGEADYAGALVEFRRAYAISPNATTLYNEAEAQYQMQDYAGALKTFRRFLSEAAPNDAHRTEVEGHVQVLRSRVGRVQIFTVPAGADVIVDDQAVGKTPLRDPVVVSVGHRRLVASMAGRLPVTQFVDVAAGDEVQVTLTLPSAGEAGASLRRSTPGARSASGPEARPADRAGLRAFGWITTGILAAGAASFGVLALSEAHTLDEARHGLTTSATLSHDASLTSTYSVLADSLGAAAVLLGGLSLYWTLAPSGSSEAATPAATRRANVVVGLGSARLEMNF